MYFKCKGSGGATVTIDGVEVEDDLALSSGYMDVSVSTLPYTFNAGDAVVYQDKIQMHLNPLTFPARIWRHILQEVADCLLLFHHSYRYKSE